MKIISIVLSLMFLGVAPILGADAEPYDPAPEAQQRLEAARKAKAPSKRDRISRQAAFIARGVLGATALHAATAYYFNEQMSFSMFIALASAGGAIGDALDTSYPLQPSKADCYEHAFDIALVDLDTRTEERDVAQRDLQKLQDLQQQQAASNRSRNWNECNIS